MVLHDCNRVNVIFFLLQTTCGMFEVSRGKRVSRYEINSKNISLTLAGFRFEKIIDIIFTSADRWKKKLIEIDKWQCCIKWKGRLEKKTQKRHIRNKFADFKNENVVTICRSCTIFMYEIWIAFSKVILSMCLLTEYTVLTCKTWHSNQNFNAIKSITSITYNKKKSLNKYEVWHAGNSAICAYWHFRL